jgi:hypothetical protein
LSAAVKVDEVASRGKIKHERANKKTDCNSGGKVMVDKDGDVVVEVDSEY